MNKYETALNGWKWACRNGLINIVHERTLQELVDKATPKKPYHGEWGYRCPTCGSIYVYDYEYDREFDYCSNCGQKLDWSEWCNKEYEYIKLRKENE